MMSMMSAMNQMAGAIISAVADHTLRVLLLTVVLAVVMRLVWPARTRVHLLGWTLIVAAAVLMPAMSLVFPPWNLLGSAGGGGETSAAVAGATTQFFGLAVAVQERAALSWREWSQTSGPMLALSLYLVGLCLGLVRLGFGWQAARNVVARARPVVDDGLVGHADAIAVHVGLRAAPRVVESVETEVPFVTGLTAPTLVLPYTWRTWDDQRRDAVLLHECAHVARRDLLAIHLVTFYRVAMWVNPAAWWMGRRLHTLVESASDEAVLEGGVDRAAYAETLVTFMSAAQRHPTRATWQLSMARRGDRQAEHRIDHVLDWKGDEMGMTTRMKMGVLGVVLVAAVAIAVVGISAQRGSLPLPVPIVVEAKGPVPTTQGFVSALTTVRAEPEPTPTVAAEASPEQAPEGNQGGYAFDTPGLVPPSVRASINPKYTPEAMRARIEGRVSLMALIGTDGTVTDVRVQQSLDDVYGLDESAMQSARRWTFRPGSLKGRAVPVWVAIEMEFRLH